jgi:hypothetical protein
MGLSRKQKPAMVYSKNMIFADILQIKLCIKNLAFGMFQNP